MIWGFCGGGCARVLKMTSEKRDQEQDGSDAWVPAIAEGFVALLGEQLKWSSEKALEAALAYQNGQIKDVIKNLHALRRIMARTNVSLNTVLMLLDPEDFEPR